MWVLHHHAAIRANDLPDAVILVGGQIDRERGILSGFPKPAEGNDLEKSAPFLWTDLFHVGIEVPRTNPARGQFT